MAINGSLNKINTQRDKQASNGMSVICLNLKSWCCFEKVIQTILSLDSLDHKYFPYLFMMFIYADRDSSYFKTFVV